jgi:threonine synthase
MESTLTHLECSTCKKTCSHDGLRNLCACGKPLLARYDLEAAARSLTRAALADRNKTMWRYAEVLPPGPAVTLGEGMTPLLHAARLGARLGLPNLFVKDEGMNPTGSFKARGLSAAVTRARALGARTLAIPTAGNAGGALAAYAARAGLECVIAMPADTPLANVLESRGFGADVRLIDGLISDCGKFIAEQVKQHGWFDVSTLKEPYRIEGKKTMGYELWEQMGELPDVILYPTGGGVGLIGMWKAFAEMQQMGWIGQERPRMVAVQAAGCAPVVRAFEQGSSSAEFWPGAATLASGLRVPRPLGDFLILAALKESAGAAVSVTDEEMMAACRELATAEGVFAAPEGGACLAAVGKLAAANFVRPEDKIVLFITGSGYKYVEAWREALQAAARDS